jgi:hypothetical protein
VSGRLEAIHIAAEAKAPVFPLETARLLTGRGIEGDRYTTFGGTFSDWPRDHELTLIEAEAIEAVAVEYNLTFAPGETRRNLTTRGIRLNPLVGKRFRVGGVLCEGTRLCEPCAHLERITGRGGLARLFVGRCGLRALILEDGEIHVGDAIVAE